MSGQSSARPSLARRYDEPIEVERRDDDPVAFVRRGRRYAVRQVLAHWWETGPWWTTVEPDGGVGDDERELWRVEAAAPGRGVVVAELCFAWVSGRWTLAAVLD
jgi:hypothetical protein